MQLNIVEVNDTFKEIKQDKMSSLLEIKLDKYVPNWYQ